MLEISSSLKEPAKTIELRELRVDIIHPPLGVYYQGAWKVRQHQLLQNEHLEDHEEGWFVKEVTQALTGWRPPTELTRNAMLVWMWVTTIISIIRIALN